MSQLSVRIDSRPGAAVVTVIGMADLDGAGVLERQLKSISADRSTHVVFDLSRLTFISSISIGVLLKFRGGIVGNSGRVSLARLGPMIEGAFTHAGLENLLPMFDSVEDALASTPPVA